MKLFDKLKKLLSKLLDALRGKKKKEDKQTKQPIVTKPKEVVVEATTKEPEKVAGINERQAVRSFWISEKATAIGQNNKYTFLVQAHANKNEIKKEIGGKFKVRVIGVNTINYKGKPKRWGARTSTTGALKKAIVTLKEGDKIEATV